MLDLSVFPLFAICLYKLNLSFLDLKTDMIKKVFAWTVDDTNSMEKMLSEHVDAIVTSNPSLLQQFMHETRTECMEDGFALP